MSEDNIFKNRNDYSVQVWMKTEKVAYMEYVNDVAKYLRGLDEQHIEWQYANVYTRRNRKYLKRYYQNNSGAWERFPRI